MTEPADHPLVTAVKPLVDAMGARILAPDEAAGDDVVLAWEGEDVLAVRLPQLADSLDHILAAMERRHGMPLAELDRKTKQAVVRALEARGAFSVRHGVETVAGALGVSRFTVYNYLNRDNTARAAE
ncbi:transcriptional regulator [Streptomyces solincola]|uniref:Transcriptional regulator n=1 Tax=Streptomyces solincola TaxID=2100817 RepID=A0A2S9PTK1_9ACTN|nr:helix-turn-helix domain-containing protein [Streptomyces solincola]PRH77734.1 transcriptional regulator [Streptomyces solincola]